MERYQVGDEVIAHGRGPGCIRAVARPRSAIEAACAPVMPHLGRLSLQGKRFQLPQPNDGEQFQGAITQYLIETEHGLEWLGWHLVRRAPRAGSKPWMRAFPVLLDWTPAELAAAPAYRRPTPEPA
ncbi:hypothetical protein JN531_006030 [Flagellatimonas centrodinii]|uniref:hypothetical protein n=1 Tax=Flagellatimonas centrodinii TaxID=2806210 RepID=UPI001FEFE40C|nr:hypothetical protein [Flagellatimonas centrodinii]ULQ47847.1 hypothetical protein JN531_006030 [Flagellatimonas centrodinii]